MSSSSYPKGRRLQRNSYISTPKDQTSDSKEYPWAENTSGDM